MTITFPGPFPGSEQASLVGVEPFISLTAGYWLSQRTSGMLSVILRAFLQGGPDIIYLRKQSGQGKTLTDSQPARKKGLAFPHLQATLPAEHATGSNPRCLCHRHHVTLKCSKNIPIRPRGPQLPPAASPQRWQDHTFTLSHLPKSAMPGFCLSLSEEEREAQSDEGTPQDYAAEMTELNYKLAVWVQSHKCLGSISLWNTAPFCPPA